MMNDNMTQEDRLSRSAQGELNDGLTDELGNNVGVGLPHTDNASGVTPLPSNLLTPDADGEDEDEEPITTIVRTTDN